MSNYIVLSANSNEEAEDLNQLDININFVKEDIDEESNGAMNAVEAACAEMCDHPNDIIPITFKQFDEFANIVTKFREENNLDIDGNEIQ